MKQITYLIYLIFFSFLSIQYSCKGQEKDSIEEIKSKKKITIKTDYQKKYNENLIVVISVPKTYLIKTNQDLKLVDIGYYKHIENNDNDFVFVDRENKVNLNDTVNVNIKYSTIIKNKDFKNLIKSDTIENEKVYEILYSTEISNALEKFKKDEILFKYRYEDDPKELQVLSIPVNLE